ncbi:MAG TPA: type II toxin-antitoxin system VapC family toxin [Galbitalea sp.]
MIVLDTNVVSELMRARPDSAVVAWLDAQQSDDLHLTAVTAAELFFGVARIPAGSRKTSITSAIADMLEHDFTDRILPFDTFAAIDYGQLVAHREQLGHPIGMADGMIAATALSAGASCLATRNTKDFGETGLALVNPWTAS